MRFWLLLVVFVQPVCAGAQSPWTRSKAGFYTQLAWHFIPAYESLYAPGGGTSSLERTLSEQTLQLYGEYGLSNRTTATVSVPFRFLNAGDLTADAAAGVQTEAGHLNGLGNISLAARHRFAIGALDITGALQADFPVDKYNLNSGLSLGYNALTIKPMLSMGQGYAKAYWFTYAGYAYRTNGFSHAFNLGAEGGLHLGRFWAIAFSEWLQPLFNGDVLLSNNNNRTGLYVNNQGYVAVGFKPFLTSTDSPAHFSLLAGRLPDKGCRAARAWAWGRFLNGNEGLFG
ncbi:MAG: hypothetical protein ACOYNO_04425 [Saprospiraceae bacterium]